MMKTKVNNKHVFRSAILSTLLFTGVLFVAATEIYNEPNLFLNEQEIEKTILIEQKEEKVIFQVVETMPAYPGGFEALQTFIADNIQYPKMASENGISGKVFVGFVINPKGEVTDAKIVRGVDPSLDAEALRVINAMPNWSPGKQRGKAVNVAFNLPINFALDEEEPSVDPIKDVSVNYMNMKITDRSVKTVGDKTEIQATVVDEKGQPLAGATAMILGTSKGTMTDKNGEFKLLIDNPDQAIRISFVGKKTLSVKFGQLIEEITGDVVFEIVEDMPEYPGGEKAMMNYLAQTINYPSIAQKNGIQGRVYCKFIVAKDGSIKDVKIARGADPILDKEAIRVIQAMPKWTPGKQKGKNVNVSYMLPINFVLKNSQKGTYEKLSVIEKTNNLPEAVLIRYDVQEEKEAREEEKKARLEKMKAESIKISNSELKESRSNLNLTFIATDFYDKELQDLKVSLNNVEQKVKPNRKGEITLKKLSQTDVITLTAQGKKPKTISVGTKYYELKNGLIFQIVEEMPKFPGGEEAMMKYLSENINYPSEAQKKGDQGRVYCNFIVAKDGSIENVKVVRGVCPSLDEEALRVVNAMPKWTPGKQRGKNVNVSFLLPINFSLN